MNGRGTQFVTGAVPLAFEPSCPICRSREIVALKAPHAGRSMASDGRVLPSALRKASCNACGHGFHLQPPTVEERDGFYDADYDVGLRDVGADLLRAKQYAGHIKTALDRHDLNLPASPSVIEFGCGSGALLGLIAEEWNARRAIGIEPAARLAAAARIKACPKVEILQAFAEGETGELGRHDLALSVNVVEHALDPVAFLKVQAHAVTDDGIVVVVCPDGNRAQSELLFLDHLSSFTTSSMSLAAKAAGLCILARSALDEQQSGFQMFLLRKGPHADDQSRTDHSSLSAARNTYLRGWSEMEASTLDAMENRPYAIFGIGEYADLLEAYCPRLTDGAQLYVVDTPGQPERNGKPVISLEAFRRQGELIAVAAVNPRNWAFVKCKFSDLPAQIVHPYEFSSLRTEL